MKGFLRRLFGSGKVEDRIIQFRVRCGNCKEIVDVNVNKDYDLQQCFDSEDGGYILNKEVQDSKCFKIMRLTARFDRHKKLMSKNISEGEFVKDE